MWAAWSLLPAPAQADAPADHRLTLLQAVEAVVNRHPLLLVQQAQVEIARSLRLQASSVFDTVVTAGVTQQRSAVPLTAVQQQEYALIAANGTSEQANTTTVSAGVSRLFRSGIQLSASLPLQRTTDNIADPDGINTAQPVLQVVVPLLRGRGKSAVAASEIAAGLEVEATGFDLTQEVAQLATVAAADYYTLVAAQQQLTIGQEAERRTRTDLDNTQTLVDADQIPHSNLNEVRANLAQATQTVAQLQQGLSTAQVQLATDMGLSPAEIVTLRPLAAETMPDFEQNRLPDTSDAAVRSCVAAALTQRADYLAAQKRVDEQAVLVTAARNGLLPVLNVTGSMGYDSLKEGRNLVDLLTSPGSNISQPNASVGLAYSFAPRNEFARGVLLQALSVETQRREQALQTARTISNAVGIAIEAVYHNKQATEAAAAAVASYQASLAGQRDKFHLGMASVVDLITVENNLTLAMNTEVQARLNYALAIVQLRFATGTIISPSGGVKQISADIFRKLPAVVQSP